VRRGALDYPRVVIIRYLLLSHGAECPSECIFGK